MQPIVLIALCALATSAIAQSQGFSSSSSWHSDEKKRFDQRHKFVARAQCGCSSSGNAGGDYDGCYGSSSTFTFSTETSTFETSSTSEMTTETSPGTGSTSSVSTGSTGSVSTGSTGSMSTASPSSIGSTGFSSTLSSLSTLFTSPSSLSTSTPGTGDCESSDEYQKHHGGWYEGDYAFILRIFISWSAELSASDSVKFRAFIDFCQKSIIENGKYSDDERFVRIQFELKAFFEANISIKEKFKWKYIDFEGFQWGYLDQLESTALDVLGNASLSVISKEDVIKVSGGKNPLTEAAYKWAGNDTSKKAAADSFSKAVLDICQSSEADELKFSDLRQVFIDFQANFSSYASSFFAADIDGFAQIGSFRDYTSREWRVQHFSVAIGGSASSNVLIKALKTLEVNSTLSISFRSQIKQLRLSIETEINATISIDERLDYTANVTYQFFLLNNWNVSILLDLQIEGYGSLFELIDAYISFYNGQIKELTTTSKSTTSTTTTSTTTKPSTTTTSTTTTTTPTTTTTTKPTTTTTTPTTTTTTPTTTTTTPTTTTSTTTTTTKPPTTTTSTTTTTTTTTTKPSTTTTTVAPTTTTTKAPTTTSTSTTTTTKAPTTTTVAPGSCSNVRICNEFDTYKKNSTLLISSIIDAQSSWSAVYVAQFSGYLKKLYAIASNKTITADDCFSQSKLLLNNFSTKGSTIYTMVHSVVIAIWGGPVDAYCNCA